MSLAILRFDRFLNLHLFFGLFLQVGTAKVNTERSSIHRVRKNALLRRQQDLHSGIMHGTVPYLGSFLSDLTYLHTAKPDYLEVMCKVNCCPLFFVTLKLRENLVIIYHFAV